MQHHRVQNTPCHHIQGLSQSILRPRESPTTPARLGTQPFGKKIDVRLLGAATHGQSHVNQTGCWRFPVGSARCGRGPQGARTTQWGGTAVCATRAGISPQEVPPKGHARSEAAPDQQDRCAGQVSSMVACPPQLVWLLVKDNNAYLRRNVNNTWFSTEKGNLYGRSSYKYSGAPPTLQHRPSIRYTWPISGLYLHSMCRHSGTPASLRLVWQLRHCLRVYSGCQKQPTSIEAEAPLAMSPISWGTQSACMH